MPALPAMPSVKITYIIQSDWAMRLLIVMVTFFCTSLYGQNAREIIAHYLDTVSNGRVENWNKIESIYTESEVYYSQKDFNGDVDLLHRDKPSFHKRFTVLPYNQKEELYADSSFLKLTSTFYYLKDKTVIVLDNMPPMIKEPTIRDEFHSVHLPVQIAKLLQKSRSVELLRIKEFPLEGFLCYEIRMTTKGRRYILYINTETFLLEYWNGREDEDLSILTRFSSYKKIENFLIPMSEKLVKNGAAYFWSDTKKYLINPEIDIELFDYKGN